MSSAGEVIALNPGSITVDPQLQQRADGLDRAWARELAEVVNAGTPFRDAPVVFEDADGEQWLAVGFHRHEAYQIAKVKTGRYEVRIGTKLDALRFALGGNADHGKPRTNADKRMAVQTALEHPQLSELSNHQIAGLCRVSPTFVGEIRRVITGATPDPVKADAAREGHVSRSESRVRRDEITVTPQPAQQPLATSAVRQTVPPAPATVPLDDLGRPVPAFLHEAFESGKLAREVITTFQTGRRTLRTIDRDRYLGGFFERNPLILATVDELLSYLAGIVPYCVCPRYHDKAVCDATCPACGGSCWLTRAMFDGLPPPMQDRARSLKAGEAWEGEVDDLPDGARPAFPRPGAGQDALGETIPARLRDAFSDEFLAGAASALRKLAKAIGSATWNPWLRPTVAGTLKDLADHVDGARPYAICPRCDGGGCAECKTKGFRPAWQRHELARAREKFQ